MRIKQHEMMENLARLAQQGHRYTLDVRKEGIMEHTPGPWTVRFTPAHDGPTAETFGPNAEANARLIAAAPDLLAALERSMFSLHQMAYPITNGHAFELQHCRAPVCVQGRAAIESAKGA